VNTFTKLNLFTPQSKQLLTESQRFLDIDKLRVAKLEKLRNVETELESQRSTSNAAKELLEKERSLCESLADQNNELLGRVKYLTGSLEDQRSQLKSLSDQFKSSLDESTKANESVAGEYELKLMNMQDIVDSLRQEIINLNEEVSKHKSESKSAKSQSTQRLADLQETITKLTSQVDSANESKKKIVAEQRLMIDQLTNSMSEAAMQLMEAQNNDNVSKSDLEDRDSKIDSLKKNIDSLHDIIGEKDSHISKLRSEIDHLHSAVDQMKSHIQSQSESLTSTKSELDLKISESNIFKSKLKSLEILQSKLYKELDSLPVINKRLEADCKFLRDDLKATSERLKRVVEESEITFSKLQAVDSLLTTEQRIKLNEKLTTTHNPHRVSEASALAENKRLLVEAMELRMRLVDSQAARDKAQSQILEQSQLIARLQRPVDMNSLDDDENNDPAAAAIIVSPKRLKKFSTSHQPAGAAAPLTEEECRQQ